MLDCEIIWNVVLMIFLLLSFQGYTKSHSKPKSLQSRFVWSHDNDAKEQKFSSRRQSHGVCYHVYSSWRDTNVTYIFDVDIFGVYAYRTLIGSYTEQ